MLIQGKSLIREEHFETDKVANPVMSYADICSTEAVELAKAVLTNNQTEKATNNTITETGWRTVCKSILCPSTSINEIHDKQAALREIRENSQLRAGIEKLLEGVRYHEDGAIGFLKPGWCAGDKYENQASLRELVKALPKLARELPVPQTSYLSSLRSNLEALNGSPIEKLAQGPVFRTLLKRKVFGLRELLEKPTLVSPLPFNPSSFKVTYTLAGAAICGGLGAGFILAGSELESKGKPVEAVVASKLASTFGATVVGTLGIVFGGFIGNMVGGWRDNINFIDPMEDRFTHEGQSAYESIGKLDELIAFDRFALQSAHASLPDMSIGNKHSFVARNLVNAVQSKKIKGYVPNDVSLGTNCQRLIFLTGPNSGGKTSLGKSIAQAQILAQAGCYVPADSANINIADKIFYQVGKNDSLQDSEGGLGTQFAQTRDMFFASTPRTLIVIDDLIEGTTFEEKTRHTRNQLYGFAHKGPTTIYVSHHYELAQEFARKGVGDFLQVEFNGIEPTHRIIPGISSNSHSDLVAQRVGYDEEAITKHLRETGYLQAGQNLEDF